eukprot:scaffold91618_cov56-Phaeocystis_antarctica.AAC.2
MIWRWEKPPESQLAKVQANFCSHRAPPSASRCAAGDDRQRHGSVRRSSEVCHAAVAAEFSAL